MLTGIGMFLALISIILFQIKVLLYYKAENPDKGILRGYISAAIIPYLISALFPVSRNRRIKADKVQLLNTITYWFYAMLAISFFFGYLGSISDS
jgi:hypothetical protein